MICAHCRRTLKHPAARVGRLGLLAPPSVRAAVCDVRTRAERDERTQDLFEGVAA